MCSSKSKSAEMVLLTFLLPQSRVGRGGGVGEGGQKTHPGHRLDPSHHVGITDDAEYISASFIDLIKYSFFYTQPVCTFVHTVHCSSYNGSTFIKYMQNRLYITAYHGLYHRHQSKMSSS